MLGFLFDSAVRTLLEFLMIIGEVVIPGLLLIFLYCLMHWVGRRSRDKRERERLARRERRAAYAAPDFKGEIRCIGGGHRGPERVAGPDSRTDRLPFSGRNH